MPFLCSFAQLTVSTGYATEYPSSSFHIEKVAFYHPPHHHPTTTGRQPPNSASRLREIKNDLGTFFANVTEMLDKFPESDDDWRDEIKRYLEELSEKEEDATASLDHPMMQALLNLSAADKIRIGMAMSELLDNIGSPQSRRAIKMFLEAVLQMKEIIEKLVDLGLLVENLTNTTFEDD